MATVREHFIDYARGLAKDYADSQVSQDADSKRWSALFQGYLDGMIAAFGLAKEE